VNPSQLLILTGIGLLSWAIVFVFASWLLG
jgi:hypothetical protein